MPKPIDQLIHCRWIIPVVPADLSLENHSLAVDAAGTIIDILPTEQAKQRYQARASTKLLEHIVIPGLINTHGHLAMSLLRGYADDYPLHSWLNEHIWPAEGQHVSPEFVADGTELALAEMIRSGTTCFSDGYFFPENSAKIAEQVGIRGHLYTPIINFPNAWSQNPEQGLEKTAKLIGHYRNHPLITIGYGPHAPYTVSDNVFEQIARQASDHDASIMVHLHETAHEVEESMAEYGLRPSARLAQLGLFGSNTQCVHMTQIDSSDIELLQQSGAHVIHCPESNLKLASGFCPVQDLIEAGINVSLGTDGAASNNDLDMLAEMRTAALLAKGVSGNAEALNAQQALAMATINGAKTLGIDKITGSLEVGKQADITAIEINHIAATPIYHPSAYVVYNSCGRDVSDVWVAGKPLLRQKRLTTIDEKALSNKVESWRQKIA